MSTLSRKILQLMSLETQLGILKEEIIGKHQEMKGEAENTTEDVPETLKQKIQEYESISGAYNDLFKEILEESIKMRESYNKEKKEQDTDK